MATGKVTKQVVDALKPGAADTFLWDAGDKSTKGFGVKVTASGSRIYIFQYRLGGRGAITKRYTIGRHGTWTADAARKEAERLDRLVSQGGDPLADKQERQRVAVDLAFQSYGKRFLESYVRSEWRASYAFAEGILRLHVFPVLALLWHFVIEGVCEKFLTMRAAQWRRLSEEVEDRLPDGWHARFWRRTPDSFFSVPLP